MPPFIAKGCLKTRVVLKGLIITGALEAAPRFSFERNDVPAQLHPANDRNFAFRVQRSSKNEFLEDHLKRNQVRHFPGHVAFGPK